MTGGVNHAVGKDELAVAIGAGRQVYLNVVGADLLLGGRHVVGPVALVGALERKAEVAEGGHGIGAGGVDDERTDRVDQRVHGREARLGVDELGEDVVGVGLHELAHAPLAHLGPVEVIGAALPLQPMEAGGLGPVARLARKDPLAAQAGEEAPHAALVPASHEGQHALGTAVVEVGGQVLGELGVLQQGVEGELVVDPDALPAVEGPEPPVVVVREVVVEVVLAKAVGARGLRAEAVGVGPREVGGVKHPALALALQDGEVLAGKALGEAVGKKVLESRGSFVHVDSSMMGWGARIRNP